MRWFKVLGGRVALQQMVPESLHVFDRDREPGSGLLRPSRLAYRIPGMVPPGLMPRLLHPFRRDHRLPQRDPAIVGRYLAVQKQLEPRRA